MRQRTSYKSPVPPAYQKPSPSSAESHIRLRKGGTPKSPDAGIISPPTADPDFSEEQADNAKHPLLLGKNKILPSAFSLDGTSTSISLSQSYPESSSQSTKGARKLSLAEEAEEKLVVEAEEAMDFSKTSRKSQWLILAVGSGACAAFNGVFAKLTTTQLTTTWATFVANVLDLEEGEKVVEVVVRAIFFALNLVFNGIMWTLFTKALARGTSTTQVSIINTSSNFMITAILGFIIFSESLPPLWFLGAATLVAGNVIIGRREEADASVKDEDRDIVAAENGVGSDEEEGSLIRESLELDDDLKDVRGKKHVEDVLQVDLDERGEERLI